MEAIPQPIFTLNKYTQNPLDIRFDIDLNESEALDICRKLTSSWRSPFFIQWHYIKKAVNAMIECGILRKFSVRLTPDLTPKAYMRDGGDMFFSLGALLTRSSTVTLSVLCHELAHMWLSQRGYYSELKLLSKSFLTRYAKVPDIALMSPIELYAMVISVDIMKAINKGVKKQKHKRRLESIIDCEREKIEFLKQKITELQFL